MKQFILKYVDDCEGWKTAIKQLHWDARNLEQHKLCDEIAETIADFQDQVSEVEQSISGNLALNKLQPTKYKITTLKNFINDVIDTTNKFYKQLENAGDKYIGMRSDCESFLSEMQRKLYLVNFTIKEDKRRQRDFQNLVEEITNDVMKRLI
jgi:flagellar biosynthesis chaperone FliJ